MFHVLFLCYQKWSDDITQTLNATQNQLSNVFKNDKAPSCMYKKISLHRLEKLDKTEFGNLCMNHVYAFINKWNKPDCRSDKIQHQTPWSAAKTQVCLKVRSSKIWDHDYAHTSPMLTFSNLSLPHPLESVLHHTASTIISSQSWSKLSFDETILGSFSFS